MKARISLGQTDPHYRPLFLATLLWQATLMAAATYQNPILPGNLADPAVLPHEGSYYLYATGDVDNDNGYRVYTSTNLVDWQRGAVVFRPGQPHVWAPDVWRDPASGRFYLYFTVNQTVGVADADSPLGPFTSRRKFFDQAIDAHLFRDDDGKLFLYYVQLPGFRISVQPMASPTEPQGEPIVLIQPESDWEKRSGHVTEGPWLIKHQGRYYLLYSGSGADTPNYAVGYATADRPTGPFTRAPHNPIVHRAEGLFGPGHGCAVQDGAGQWWHVYHQKRNDRVEWDRFICLDPLKFDSQGNLHGSASRGSPQPAPAPLSRSPAMNPTGPTHKIPIILSTDIGDDIDDTWALALLLRCPELDLRLVLGDYGNPLPRARLLAKFLETAGRTDIPVGVGIDAPWKSDFRQAKWVEGYDLDRYPGKVHRDGVQAMIDLVMASPEPVTLVGIGPLPNIAEALRREPRLAQKARFVGMHGSVRVGYGQNSPPAAEWNVRANPAACRTVFSAPWDITITPLDTCGRVQLRGDKYAQIRQSTDPMIRALVENYHVWTDWNISHGEKGVTPPIASSTLFDCVAVYLAVTQDLCVMESLRLRVDDDGFTREDPAAPKLKAATQWKDLPAFEDWLVQRLTRKGSSPPPSAVAAPAAKDITNNIAPQSPLPRGPGLAQSFKADAHIATHPAVIFADDFETGDLGARWDETGAGKALSFAPAQAEVCGKRCLKVEARLGENQGGGLTKWFTSAPQIFVRFYVRFAADCDYVHHFVTLRANRGLRGGDKWSGFGGAGLCPAGDERFSTALEPWGNWARWPAPGKWNFYSYWHEMKISPDGKYWGNSFLPESQEVIPKERWICAEFMLKHNTPGQPNGEQACWIDGRLLGHWRGFNWRKTETLQANALTLESYVTDRWTKNPTNTVYFDNLVIAREYIGPAGPSNESALR